MDLHGEIMNITVEKRKQNLAIDEAMKSFKNMKDIFVAIYARGHRDARHSAAEKAAQQSVERTLLWVCASCGNYMGDKHVEGCSLAEIGG